MPTQPDKITEAQKIDIAFPEAFRESCGVVVEELCPDAACERMACELNEFRQQEVARETLKNILAKAYYDERHSPRAIEVRFTAIIEGLEIKFKRVSEELISHVAKLDRGFNPGEGLPPSAEGELPRVQVWKIDFDQRAHLRAGLKDLRLVLELLKLDKDECRCPVTAEVLTPRTSDPDNVPNVLEPDHCVPASYQHSPIKLISRAANRAFGHMPWTVKAKFFSEGQDRESLRAFLRLYEKWRKDRLRVKSGQKDVGASAVAFFAPSSQSVSAP